MSNNNKTTAELIQEIKAFFEKENSKEKDIMHQFSNDVIVTAYQKISENLKDIIDNETDPLVLSEMLQNYLNLSKAIDEKGLQKQQFLLKLFEQLVKYEQGKYF